ncbi:DUF2726 domain-containing protein [Chelativorans sp. ZYF759]|uniref:DUF2726 domain-containing protein n=1 Tax=Chelativorans sp. ZYF759 TaxID=2692213 RepID=UPI00145FB588|nr:DUF2726 domain-containing protein [Chelativorans sp. ZYF759]NMG38536.1 DUF2726 domain-containing protein [Chelativorans sp. ZYF759]
MLTPFLADFEQLLLLTGVLLVGAAVGSSIERYRSSQRRKAWRQKNPHWEKQPGWQDLRVVPATPAPSSSASDAVDQLRIVLGAEFAARALLNRSEARVFRELDRIVLGFNPAWQVMAQVSLGEILSSRDTNAYRCINSKRVDLLLVDEHCRPRHVVEYQGGAHHQGSAAARDAVKKEALRRAGIGYHEVIAGQTTPSDLRRLIERLVDRPPELPASVPTIKA